MTTKFLATDYIAQGSCLLIPGRLDAISLKPLLEHLGNRPIIWLCEENAAIDAATLTLIADTSANAVSFSLDDDPAAFAEQLKEDLGDNGVAIYLPGDAYTLAGAASHLSAESLAFLTALGLDILPLGVLYADESVLPTASAEHQIIASFQPIIPAAEANPARWIKANLCGIEHAFSSRDFLNESLGIHLLRGLKKSSKISVFDGTSDTERNFDIILGVSLAMAKIIKKSTTKKRVGVILPASTGGLVANLAVVFAGKIPVNINFTASRRSVESAIKQADLDKFITADPFVRKMSEFAWPPQRDLLHIERLIPQNKKAIKQWVIISKILPTNLLAKIAGISTKGGDEEAIMLFTSGSSGAPKGVQLSHRNLLANVAQFSVRCELETNSTLLGSLPLFHAFGCTVTLWFPIIKGINLVTYPNPLDTKRIAELCDQRSIDYLLTTPTFLRGYMRKIDPKLLSSVKNVVTGAEKLPIQLAHSFEKKFGVLPQEGYGLTETSPATNLNIYINPEDDSKPVLPTAKLGSVGQMLPGIAIKMTDPSTEKEIDIDQSGIIWLKGENIFKGYYQQPELSEQVLDDGWFKTNDVGHVDSDGFLYIEGRISRFSKVGGEMVPHETLEETITKVLGLENETERKVVVTGIPDEKKGESLILLSTVSQEESLTQECINLRYLLLEEGIPPLWCPKIIVPVKDIPILASGKLDIRACQELALELTQTA